MAKFRNPHFDDNRVIWGDEYSGNYEPIPYSDEFDPQWKLFLEKRTGFTKHTGVETEDQWIDDRIYDLTGISGILVKDKVESNREVGGRQKLSLHFSPHYFKGKKCIDIACGAGRWTRALLALGAEVKSVDVSEHGLESVRRYNKDVEKLDLFDIEKRPDLHAAFDFVLAWGIIMSTHDPKLAFENVARTVRPGGSLYIMVYAPTYHNSPAVLAHRRHYHKELKSSQEKIDYVYQIADQAENAINYHDMLNPFYNWVIKEETIHNWFQQNGFIDVTTLNGDEPNPVAYHVFGRKRNFALPYYDDYGSRIPHPTKYDPEKIIDLSGPFQKSDGLCWYFHLPQYAAVADNMQAPQQSKLILIENGKPMWLNHSLYETIKSSGKGTYSHWNEYLYFSTTDNSDPNTNGRHYQIVFTNENN